MDHARHVRAGPAGLNRLQELPWMERPGMLDSLRESDAWLRTVLSKGVAPGPEAFRT